MKHVLIERFGKPEEVARCVEAAEPGAPGPGEVVFEVVLFPINPTDVWFCKGGGHPRPTLPATPGSECVGRVTAVGAGVTDVKPGDLVTTLRRENWTQRRTVKRSDLIPLPGAIDLRQAAMVRINPPTALLMLTDVAHLDPGDWVLQNVANSAVGKLVIALAASRRLRTVNVVRRESLFAELAALGANACVVDGPDLVDQVKAATAGAPIRLAIEAVGGEATARLGACVADGGVVCSYGSMSGADPVMRRVELIHRGVTLVGFNVGRALARRSPHEVRAIYAELAGEIVAGRLHASVEKIYPIEEIQTALGHAQQEARRGKILVAPNGPVG
jgi:NADPH:quinone reductase-like Zn-dependent oxidoreductase